MRRKIVAGLDLSLTNTGLIIIDNGNVYPYSIGYPLKKANEKQRIQRVIKISSKVMRLLQEHKVEYVALENYAFSKAKFGITLQADLGGTIKTQVYCGLKTVPILLPVNTIRKFLMGHSTKEKKPVEDFLKSKGYNQPKNNDEYDALAVALVLDAWANDRALYTSDYELEVFKKIDENI